MFKTLAWESPVNISRTQNVIWNGVSRVVQFALQILFVPVHIHLLGPSSYGLVVLCATLMALVAFIEHLASSTITREIGLHNGVPERSADLWGMVAAAERIVAGAALAIAILTPFLAFFLTRHWAQVDGLTPGGFAVALALMGGAVASQCMGVASAAALIGLQRQKLLSVIRLIWTPLYYGVGVVLLFVIERSVVVLFAWQILAFLLLAFALRHALHGTMPPVAGDGDRKARLASDLRNLGAASVLMMASGAIVSQIDKFFVAGSVKPSDFAAYGLAFSLAMQAMMLATTPFATAMFPHFARLLQEDRRAELMESYRRWTQAIVLSALVVGGSLILLGPWFIDLWLGANSELGPDVKRLLPAFVPAWILNAAITAPVILIMAAGRLHLVYLTNFALIALAVFLLPIALNRFGMEGGALYWLMVNLTYVLVMVPMMHRTLRYDHLGRWLAMDVGLPALAALGLLYGATRLVPSNLSVSASGVLGILAIGLYSVVLFMVLPKARTQLMESLRALRG